MFQIPYSDISKFKISHWRWGGVSQMLTIRFYPGCSAVILALECWWTHWISCPNRPISKWILPIDSDASKNCVKGFNWTKNDRVTKLWKFLTFHKSEQQSSRGGLNKGSVQKPESWKTFKIPKLISPQTTLVYPFYPEPALYHPPTSKVKEGFVKQI